MFQLLRGNFTNNQLKFYVIIQMGLFWILLLISRSLYPPENHYSIMTSTMSYLGSWEADKNPRGWRYFNIAVLIVCVMDIPVMLYLFQHLRIFSHWGANLALLSHIVAVIAGIAVSLLPDLGGNFLEDLQLGNLHNIFAVIHFLSFVMGHFLVISIYIFNPSIRPIKQWLFPTIWFLLAAGGMLVTKIIWAYLCTRNPDLKTWPGDGIYSFPLWEWILFVSQYVYLYWQVFII